MQFSVFLLIIAAVVSAKANETETLIRVNITCTKDSLTTPNNRKCKFPVGISLDDKLEVVAAYPKSSSEENLELNVSKNIPSNMPQGLGKVFPKLINLIVEDSILKFVERICFANMTRLWRLSLKNNRIETIPGDAFFDLPKIVIMILASNKLSSVDPQLFSRMTLLERLDLGNNQISELDPRVFSSLHNLNLLDIGDNNLKELPRDLFTNTTNLMHLYAENLQLTTLAKGIFRSTRKMATLEFETSKGAEFNDIQVNFKMLKNLRGLFLRCQGLYASISFYPEGPNFDMELEELQAKIIASCRKI